MPRSSFSDNPLLRVSRPVSACSRCRAAKVKCDGKLPACTACEKANRESECSAANDQFARGKERSYVAALELRVEKLERRLAYARSRKASVSARPFHEDDASNVSSPSADRKDSLAAIRAAIHRKAARKRENSDVNSLVSDFGYLSVDATTRDFDKSVNNLTFARLVLAAAGNTPLPESTMALSKLPSRQASYAIIQFYLTHVHILFPFLSETSLLALLEELYHHQTLSPGHGHPIRPNLSSSDYWTLYMVLAIGSSAQSCNRHDAFYNNGVEFAAHAMPFADRALAPGHAAQIQSLLLLTLYSVLDPAHFDSWHLIGFTCRTIVDLGFHQDPPQPQSMDAGALDARRRMFYCAYALDRAISMVHARAFSFTDDTVNVELPSMVGVIRSRPETSPEPSGDAQEKQQPGSPTAEQEPASPSFVPTASPALLLFQLRRAQSNWYQTLFQSNPTEQLADPAAFVWRMCAEMQRWSDTLPPNLPDPVREMFDLELQYSYVYCIAPSARVPLTTAYGRILIFEHVIAYIDRIVALVQNPLNLVWATYHDALRVFFMGSQFAAVLRDPAAADAILAGGGSVPVPLALPGEPAPPPMPVRKPPLSTTLAGSTANASETNATAGPSSPRGMSAEPVTGCNVDRAIACLHRVRWVLSSYGERWEDAERLAEGFTAISSNVLDDLLARKATQATSQAAAGSAGGAGGTDNSPATASSVMQHPRQHAYHQHLQQHHQPHQPQHLQHHRMQHNQQHLHHPQHQQHQQHQQHPQHPQHPQQQHQQYNPYWHAPHGQPYQSLPQQQQHPPLQMQYQPQQLRQPPPGSAPLRYINMPPPPPGQR